MTYALSVGIAATQLEQLYHNVLDLTHPGYTHGPANNFFGCVLGDLELVFQAVDPSHGKD